MIAALYIRVSTMEQSTEGFSIMAQLSELQEYCKKSNIEIYKAYTDEGISGTKEDRPQFQQMVSDAGKGLFGIILVHKFDRFARKIELSHKIKSILKKSNVNVISITEPIEDSPIGFFQEGLLELLAEYYVKNLSKEVKKGMKERASQGLYSGRLPHGYDFENGEVKINEEEATVIRLIFELYTSGYGYQRIYRHLFDNKIMLRKYYVNAFRIRYILTNVKYIGKIYHLGNVYDSEGKFPSIIDEETFNLVQQIKDKKNKGYTNAKEFYKSKNYEKYLLSGLLRCGSCGWKMSMADCTKSTSHNTGNARSKLTSHYYICYNAKRLKKCDFKKHLRFYQVEELVINEIKKVLKGFNVNIPIKKKISNMSNFIDMKKIKLEKEILRAKEAYLVGVFNLQEYTDVRNRNGSELIEIEKQKDNSELQVNNVEILIKKIENVWDEFETCDNILKKKELLLTFIDSIIVYNDKIEIIYNL